MIIHTWFVFGDVYLIIRDSLQIGLLAAWIGVVLRLPRRSVDFKFRRKLSLGTETKIIGPLVFVGHYFTHLCLYFAFFMLALSMIVLALASY